MITLLTDLSFGGVATSNTCKLGMFLPVTDDELVDLLSAASKDKGGQKTQAIKSEPVALPPNGAQDAAPKAPTAESAAPAPNIAPR
jgi:hypothetical protein